MWVFPSTDLSFTSVKLKQFQFESPISYNIMVCLAVNNSWYHSMHFFPSFSLAESPARDLQIAYK